MRVTTAQLPGWEVFSRGETTIASETGDTDRSGEAPEDIRSTDSVANDSRLVFAEIALLPGSALSAHFLVRAQYVGSSERNPEDLERERSGLERDK